METKSVDSWIKNSEFHSAVLVSCPFLKAALCGNDYGWVYSVTEVPAEAVSSYW